MLGYRLQHSQASKWDTLCNLAYSSPQDTTKLTAEQVFQVIKALGTTDTTVLADQLKACQQENIKLKEKYYKLLEDIKNLLNNL
ncbi:MAG: hypothetical protein LC127_06240 [Chitinophagales bacterium]|nr:hypothetical protein [Chitinophagales bacterium]